MKIRYDAEVDALSIVFRETTVTTSELAKGLAADYDAEGRLVGIEVLDATERLGDPTVLDQVVLEGVGLAPRSGRRPA
jgi:YD repeat-containing protein